MTNEEVNSALRSYVQKNLTPTAEERGMVSAVYAAVCSVLGRDRCYQIGSYPRYTAIRPPHDLDVIYSADEWPGQEPDDSKILADLKSRLETDLVAPDGLRFVVELQTHSVTVSFRREDEEVFAVDVVPAWTTGIINEFGDDVYRVPEILLRGHRSRLRLYRRLQEFGGHIGFILSDPKGYIGVAAVTNGVNSDFRKAVKFAKKWKWWAKQADEDFKLKSFHIEQIITGFFREVPETDILSALMRFFIELPQWISVARIPDRADNERYIDEYVNELTDEQRNSILAARDRFLEALRSDFSGGAVEDLFRPQPAPKTAPAVSTVGAGSAAVVTDRRSVTPRAPFGNE